MLRTQFLSCRRLDGRGTRQASGVSSGLEIGEPIIPTVYGSAIVGEGVVCWLGVKRPLRFIPILYYMVAYKLAVCVVLAPKLLQMDDAPLAGWGIIAAWGSVIVMCGIILPWGTWGRSGGAPGCRSGSPVLALTDGGFILLNAIQHTTTLCWDRQATAPFGALSTSFSFLGVLVQISCISL